MASVIVVHGGESADADLVEGLRTCGTDVRFARTTEALLDAIGNAEPDAVILELGDAENNLLPEISAWLPPTVRLMCIGDLDSLADPPSAVPPECVVFAKPDEATLCEVLRPLAPLDHLMMLTELVSLGVFDVELPRALQRVSKRLVRAFGADDCIVRLPEEGTWYSARPLTDQVIESLVPVCDAVCRFETTMIGPRRRNHPYRAFFGVTLSHDNAPPFAQILLCRERPVPFGREALAQLRGLALRLSADLSWRLVHERLLADRDKLRDLSRIDPVLGVANRTALHEELSRRVATSERHGEPFSVAIIDVDGLRLINERNGYPAGDAVLSHVAQVARVKMRPQDIVARYAGDAVALVMPGAAAEEATTMLTGILSAIDATPVVHEDTPINLTVSAGIAELRYDKDTGEAALGRAMAARDRARLHGEVIAQADDSVADAPAQPDFRIGTTLGGVYQIRHEISRGAFGVVYRAEDLALGRQVALKLMRPDLARDTALVDSFRKEAATLARIRNPNLVQVYAFGVDDQDVFFAMELVEGLALDARIHSARQRRRHLPLPEVISVIDQVAGALEAVHRAGMLHRDVKPENVLIDRIHRRCVLIDVGIAVRRGEKSAAGTPGFTAPEVFGDGGETPATDVYSLAALAYILLTLGAPFGGASPLETLHLQASQRPRPLTELRHDLPPSIDNVLLRALDPNPIIRPQNARDLAKAISEALSADAAAAGDRGSMPSFRAPRQTIEQPLSRPSMRAPSFQFGPVVPTVPSSRGILFQSAYQVLGARRGSAWMGDVSHKIPEVAIALAPGSSSLAWHPTSAFIAVLQSLGKDDEECRAIALQLGRIAVDSSFSQFYGANPAAVSPAQVLRAADVFLRCYHSWGTASVVTGETDAEVTITQSIINATLCASTAGILAGVVARSGGLAVDVEHDDCTAKGSQHCVFKMSWRTSASSEELDDGTVLAGSL